MNALEFSPLTDDALTAAAIHAAAFGRADGYVTAQEISTALHRRRTGDRWGWPNDGWAWEINVTKHPAVKAERASEAAI